MGESFNHDEIENQRIVDLKILNVIGRLAKYPIRCENKFHAGLMHTYGYLFSQLKTRYGYKRERWISGAIEKGLGISGSSLLPTSSGNETFLQNVTHLLGAFVFTKKQNAKMRDSLTSVGNGIVALKPGEYQRTRLQESVRIGRKNYLIHSDLVRFRPAKKSLHSLLVYSFGEKSRLDSFKLVTCFPVDQPSYELALASASEKNPLIRARYNIAVPGLTRDGKVGKRKLIKKRN